MNNFDEMKSLNLFGGTEDEAKTEGPLNGEVCDAEDEKSEALGSILDFLSQMKGLDSDDDDDEADDESCMDADDYHNKAVEYARRDQYKRATDICTEGLKRYPLNVDLLADTVEYSCKYGDMSAAAIHYLMLRKLPFSRWNWRAFSFSCDYLLESSPIENEEEIRLLVKHYKRVLPYEEKACMAESELEKALGNHAQSMKVLVDSIQHYTNASQCALRLADMQFERGMYADVVDTCNYGIAASAEPQPSISIPYLLLLRVMSKDHLLIQKANHGTVTASEVREISDEYKLLLDEFPHQMARHSDTIETRRSVLKFIHHED